MYKLCETDDSLSGQIYSPWSDLPTRRIQYRGDFHRLGGAWDALRKPHTRPDCLGARRPYGARSPRRFAMVD